MKRICISITLLVSMLIISSNSYSQDDIPIPDGPYLGQNPSGSTPKVFAPGIVNTEEYREVEGMFGADMNTFYFVRGAGKDKPHGLELVVIEYKNNQWHESVVKEGVSEPSISPDGMTIFSQNRYMERTKNSWSELKSLPAPLGELLIMRLSASSNGTYYFDTYTKKQDTPLRYSRLIDGKYEQPKSLGQQFGIGRYNAHPFIAPDESYIIFDSQREGGYGRSDIYISFRDIDGSWGPVINMGDKINTTNGENYPSVSPDGKFIFFDRRSGKRINGKQHVDIYWVDAQIIETLRPK